MVQDQLDNLATELDRVCGLTELHDVLSRTLMWPGWNKPEPSLYPEPKRVFVPAHWRYSLARAALDAAGRHVSTELAERRNLILANPIAGNTYPTVRTIVAAYQMVLAGETARSHRHTPNALRLVVDVGPDTYTIVEGKKLLMEPGDVVLTPNWLWHGHSNEGDQAAYWIDFLDAPLVQFLEPMFFEQFPGGIEKPKSSDPDSSLRFPWTETANRLDALEPASDLEIELGNPALDSLAVHVRRIEAGATTPIRTTASNVYAVIEGEGEIEIEDRTFAWKRGDVVAAPAWHTHYLRTRERCHLLRVSDEPVLRSLNWLKTNVLHH